MMNADPGKASSAVSQKEPSGLILEKIVVPGVLSEPNMAEGTGNNKGKAVEDPPESSSVLGEKKKGKSIKKGAKGGLIPRAQS